MPETSISEFVDNKDEGLHFGHLGLIFACAAFLSLATLMKTGFVLPFSKNKFAGSPPKVLTYDEVYQKVALKNADEWGIDPVGIEKDRQQLALIDPDLGQGQVAGISTGQLQELGFPNVNEIIGPDQLASVPIVLLDSTSEELVLEYKENSSEPELQGDIISLLADINSDDPEVLRLAGGKAEKILTQLMQIPVPKDLAEYHRLNMFYIFELGLLAEAQSGIEGAPEVKDITPQIFSLAERLEQMKADIAKKYQVEL